MTLSKNSKKNIWLRGTTLLQKNAAKNSCQNVSKKCAFFPENSIFNRYLSLFQNKFIQPIYSTHIFPREMVVNTTGKANKKCEESCYFCALSSHLYAYGGPQKGVKLCLKKILRRLCWKNRHFFGLVLF